MHDSACNFCINENFNANYDITWSFQYSLTGSNISTGGFSTFLFDNNTLSGGGRFSGLGYSNYESIRGVYGAILGITFDSNNTVKILKGSSFTQISSFPLFSEVFPLIKQTETFNTIRFNLTDLGKTLNISIKDKLTNNYKIVKTINTYLLTQQETYYRIGVSYATPIATSNEKICFKIKDIHVQGNKNIPDTKISKKPYDIKSYYILQSPSEDKIKIHTPDSTTSGYLKHK